MKLVFIYFCSFRAYSNALEAVSRAAVEAVKIVATICANILVFIALLQFADRTVEWFGDQAGVPHLTLSVGQARGFKAS